MSALPQRAAGKRVSWGELFFDLVFVFAITRISLFVHDDHSALGLVEAFVAFLLVWCGWGPRPRATSSTWTAPGHGWCCSR